MYMYAHSSCVMYVCVVMICRADLEVEHYGMKKLKKRILEFLAVRQLKNKMKGRPISCIKMLSI